MEFTTMARGEITGKKPAQTADEAKRLPGPPIADATMLEPSAAEGDPEAAADAEKPAQIDEQQAEPSSADSKAIEPSAKSDPRVPAKKAKATPIRGPPTPAAWYTIREFCVAHRLSISMFFKLKADKRGPRETAVGSRRYITFEDAAAWRAAQQQKTAAKTNATPVGF
jgi:hypothetical protein